MSVALPEPVAIVTTPISLAYRYTAGAASSRFLEGTRRRTLLGRRCSRCAKVYMPPRGACSMCGAPYTEEDVPVADVGTITTFAVVNVPFASRTVELPYACVEVRFDGADITSQFLLQGCPIQDARMGMRVRAHWRDDDELEPNLGNIEYVEPVDEPDALYEAYREFV